MDLFEFFQKQEQQLYEAPPERVWKRLEVRLEQRRRRRQRRWHIRFLQIGSVLVVLLLLLLAAVLVWYFARREGL